MLAGLGSGAWETVAGLADLVKSLITSPIQTAAALTSALGTILDTGLGLFGPNAGQAAQQAAQLLVPDLYKLVTQPNLSKFDQGFLLGKVIGQFAASLLTGNAVGQVANAAGRLMSSNFFRNIISQVGQQVACFTTRLACFAAGTPLMTPDGAKPIESFQPGDLVLCASEFSSEGPVEARPVREIITHRQTLWNLRVNGRTIQTTALHPFYVRGLGWKPAQNLQAGDLLRSHDGQWLPVEAIAESGEEATVYNLHVAEYHTYFVGTPDWGFSVWAHNTCLVDQIRTLANSGVQGAQRLVRMMESRSLNLVLGAYFQAKRVMCYSRLGLLDKVEYRIGSRFGDILLRNGLRVECKSWWRGWASLSETVQGSRLEKLTSQINNYLESPGSRLMLEFESSIPPNVLELLEKLAGRYNIPGAGNRLIWTVIPL